MKQTNRVSKETRALSTAPRQAEVHLRDDACMQPCHVGDTSVIGRDFDVIELLKRRKRSRTL
jgi:hypothetical protein